MDQETIEVVRSLNCALADLTDHATSRRGIDLYTSPGRRIMTNTESALRRSNAWLNEHDVPTWQPGDVVQVTFSRSNPKAYTYVRGERDWPGDQRRLSDERMNTMYRNGQVKRVRIVADDE